MLSLIVPGPGVLRCQSSTVDVYSFANMYTRIRARACSYGTRTGAAASIALVLVFEDMNI